MNRIMSAPTQPKRAESLAERPVRPWAERLAHAIPFFVLPSGVWRLAVAFGFPMGMLNDAGKLAILRGWPAIYVAAISLLSEAVALTAFARSEDRRRALMAGFQMHLPKPVEAAELLAVASNLFTAARRGRG